jgi:hypothetical protein
MANGSRLHARGWEEEEGGVWERGGIVDGMEERRRNRNRLWWWASGKV